MLTAAVKAEHLLEELGLTDVPVSPEKVCEAMSSRSCQISFVEKPMSSEGFLGVSLGGVNGAEILINSNIPNRHRKRFTAAHEIGHVHLHILTNKRSKFECGPNEISEGGSNNNQFEREANTFASSLLMPRSAISELILQNDLSWSLIEKIKCLCDVSLEAAARRAVGLSEGASCLIIHKNGTMWNPIKSHSFEKFVPEQPFPSHLDIHTEGVIDDTLTDSLEECEFSDWRLSDRATGKLFYSSIKNSQFNRTMTLLVYDEDYEDEEELGCYDPHF